MLVSSLLNISEHSRVPSYAGVFKSLEEQLAAGQMSFRAAPLYMSLVYNPIGRAMANFVGNYIGKYL